MSGKKAMQVRLDRDFLTSLLQRCHAIEFLRVTRLQDIFENYAIITDVAYDHEKGLATLSLYVLDTNINADLSKNLHFCFGNQEPLIPLTEQETKKIKALFTG